MIKTIGKMTVLLCLALGISGCEIVDRMYMQVKKDVKTHMFPEHIADQSPPLRTDTYICDSARTLILYKNEGTGSAVVEYEGRASFLERIENAEDELYKNNQTTLRIFENGNVELAREQVPILTNCVRQVIHDKKTRFRPTGEL